MSVVCKYCEKQFKLQSNLNRHFKTVHKLEEINHEYNVYLNKCLEGCQVSFVNTMKLRQHLTQVHNKTFTEKVLEFDTEEEYEMWLLTISQTKNAQYCIKKTKRLEEIDIVYYYCNRSGNSQANFTSGRKRKMKSQGTCKLGTACTSVIKLQKKRSTGECNVKYISLHYGHTLEFQHLRLLPTERAMVAKKLANGVPESRILDSIRDSIQPDNLKRTDLITKKDIRSIKKTHNICINDGVQQGIDNVSVESGTQEFGQNEAKKQKPIREQLKEQCIEVLKLDLNDIDDDVIEHALKMLKTNLNLLKSNRKQIPVINNEPVNKKIKNKKQNSIVSINKIGTGKLVEMKQCKIATTKSTDRKEFILKNALEEHNYTSSKD